MKLLRLAALKLDPQPSKPPEMTLGDDDLVIQLGPSRKVGESRLTLVVSGVSLAHPPKRTSAGDLVVPDVPRRRLLAAIEHVVNVLAVANGAARKLVSPPFYVALSQRRTTTARCLLQRGAYTDPGSSLAAVSRPVWKSAHPYLSGLTAVRKRSRFSPKSRPSSI